MLWFPIHWFSFLVGTWNSPFASFPAHHPVFKAHFFFPFWHFFHPKTTYFGDCSFTSHILVDSFPVSSGSGHRTHFKLFQIYGTHSLYLSSYTYNSLLSSPVYLSLLCLPQILALEQRWERAWEIFLPGFGGFCFLFFFYSCFRIWAFSVFRLCWGHSFCVLVFFPFCCSTCFWRK